MAGGSTRGGLHWLDAAGLEGGREGGKCLFTAPPRSPDCVNLEGGKCLFTGLPRIPDCVNLGYPIACLLSRDAAGLEGGREGGTTLQATQGQILSQSPTDATRFWWHLYGS